MSIDLNGRCLGCMNMLPHPQAACPNCGWSRQTDQNNVGQLEQGTNLKNPTTGNQYLIGKTVGQGGFGIVYTAWDVTGNRKVAIKEYFPKNCAGRTHSNTVVLTTNSQSDKEFFDRQKKRFRQEAEKMQMFRDNNNVVTVLDFFDENNTSYIVMEFIEGQTFAQVLNNVPNQRLTLQTVLANFQPIIDILEKIHHTQWTDDNGQVHPGIIHRDISPENIMYASDGTVKLLDFGAARVSNPDPNSRLTIALKHGYAPYEQYLTTGTAAMQGSWTDVYALAATIYRAITGEIPPSAIDRWSNVATIKLPSSFGIEITPEQEQVLLKGLAINYQNRYQSVSQFYNELVFAGNVKQINNGGGQINNGGGQINNGGGQINNGGGQINNGGGQINNGGGQINNGGEQINNGGIITNSTSKGSWAVATVAALFAIFSFGGMNTNKTELDNLKNQIQTEQKQMERYQNFAADYGYASSSYYADKAIVFVNKNSEVKLPIYCDLLSGELKATLNRIDGENIITAKWEGNFNENHKTNVIITAKDRAGYSTLRFTNEANSDSFDVLVVVQ